MPWKEISVMDERRKFIIRALDPREEFRSLCREYGISTKTGYKWKERFLALGVEGLKDQSRRPKGSNQRLIEEVVCEIIKLKLSHRRWGPKKIQDMYGRMHESEVLPSLSTFNRVLAKAGLVDHRRRRKQTIRQGMPSKVEVEKPNDLWTVDFKGWWYTPSKQKCEPLTVRDQYSRYILSLRGVSNSKTEAIKAEFERLFKENGLPRAIRSDNGPPFASCRSMLNLTKLSVWWLSLGIRLDRIEPGKPYQNGAHERLHKDIKQELQGMIEGDLTAHQAAFDQWRDEFNTERPHEALGMQTPSNVYQKSEIGYDEAAVEIIYPYGYIQRLVNDRGLICLYQNKVFISNAFEGYHLGLKLEAKDTYGVWFDHLRIGQIDLTTFKFKAVAIEELNQ